MDHIMSSIVDGPTHGHDRQYVVSKTYAVSIPTPETLIDVVQHLSACSFTYQFRCASGIAELCLI
eukprot:3267504-Amphidinium_carterae.1